MTQVPSDYLFDLQALAKEDCRAVLFYDQLGCGRSDAPPVESGLYGVESSITQLREVLSATGIANKPHHLYGQSWGGLLAFLHLASSTSAMPLSLTLSNTPSSVALVEAEAGRLLRECGDDVARFMARHNFRGSDSDAAQQRLDAAYAHAGSTWRGSGAIPGLEVDSKELQVVTCPTLILRGEHDFVTDACVDAWRGLPNAHLHVLPGASHHALLEAPERYLDVLGAFLRESEAQVESPASP